MEKKYLFLLLMVGIVASLAAVSSVWHLFSIVRGCQDTSDTGHFGPKTFRHHQNGSVVSRGHFGTGTELSRPPANIFATIGCTEERLNITGYYY